MAERGGKVVRLGQVANVLDGTEEQRTAAAFNGKEAVGIDILKAKGYSTTQVSEEIHTHFPQETFATVIPRNVRLSEAPSHGKPIMLYDLRSPGSAAYLELTKEVLAHER